MSEMSATRIEKASEIVDVGEKVWIKVIGREVTQTYTHKYTGTVLLQCLGCEQVFEPGCSAACHSDPR